MTSEHCRCFGFARNLSDMSYSSCGVPASRWIGGPSVDGGIRLYSYCSGHFPPEGLGGGSREFSRDEVMVLEILSS